jgi:hypothetical protein
MFGRAYLRGYKAGLLDGEMSCLEQQIAKCEREELQVLAELGAQHSSLIEMERPRPTLH